MKGILPGCLGLIAIFLLVIVLPIYALMSCTGLTDSLSCPDPLVNTC